MFGSNNKKSSTGMLDDKSTSIISSGTSIKGDIETQGSLRLDGNVFGNCITKLRLVLGHTSIIEGNVVAKDAEISGSIKGIVKIEEMLTLKSSSKILGDIFTTKLIVEEGAQFDGKCTMGNSQKKTDSKIVTSKEAAPTI